MTITTDNLLAPVPGTIYGDMVTDAYLLRNPASLPRYAHLARKALRHYAGPAYQPHRHGLQHEPFLRAMIKDIIAYKVLYRLPTYPWAWIDHSLRKYIGRSFGLDLSFDQNVIDAGLPQGTKPARTIDWDTMH